MRASWACATHVHAVKMSTGQKRALPAWFTLYPSDRIGCLPFAISRRGLRTLLESQLPDDVGCDIQGSIEPSDRSIVDIEDDLETLVLSNSRHGWFKPDFEGALGVTLNSHELRARVLDEPLHVDTEFLHLAGALGADDFGQ